MKTEKMDVFTEKEPLFGEENAMMLEFPSKAGNETFARVCAAAFAAKLDPTVDEMADIKTAVSEAVTNSILYAYEKGKGRVTLRGLIRQNTVYFEIEDYGKGIEDVELAMQPFYTTSDNEERSGMGFTLMQAFTDELCVVSSPGKGTRVTFKKEISKDAER